LRARHVANVDLLDDMSSEGSSDGDGIDDITVVTAEGNVWPFHSDTEINNCKISCIDLENRRFATKDGNIYLFNDAIQHLNSLIS
jgi:Fe-S cluster biosynthesis and repair protein YggX